MRAVAAPAATPPAAVSPWHTPVPYLFGGLAAMMGLIALALLVLACSYWKLSGYLGGDDHAAASSSSGAGAPTDGDGSKSPATAAAASPGVFADLVAVVMAGENTPTFLAARSSVATATAAAAGEKIHRKAVVGDVTGRPAGGERSQQEDQV